MTYLSMIRRAFEQKTSTSATVVKTPRAKEINAAVIYFFHSFRKYYLILFFFIRFLYN